MNCRFCDSEIFFEAADHDLPNVLQCASCSWFYEWNPKGLGGNPTREQVEAVLARSSDHEWIELSNRRMFVWNGSTESEPALLDEIES